MLRSPARWGAHSSMHVVTPRAIGVAPLPYSTMPTPKPFRLSAAQRGFFCSGKRGEKLVCGLRRGISRLCGALQNNLLMVGVGRRRRCRCRAASPVPPDRQPACRQRNVGEQSQCSTPGGCWCSWGMVSAMTSMTAKWTEFALSLKSRNSRCASSAGAVPNRNVAQPCRRWTTSPQRSPRLRHPSRRAGEDRRQRADAVCHGQNQVGDEEEQIADRRQSNHHRQRCGCACRPWRPVFVCTSGSLAGLVRQIPCVTATFTALRRPALTTQAGLRQRSPHVSQNVTCSAGGRAAGRKSVPIV
jgi:hypothetical protein